MLSESRVPPMPIGDPPAPSICPFCKPERCRVFHEDELVVGLWDGFAVSPGHALLVPKRHVETWFDASPEEQAALTQAIAVARARILERFNPDGFNIGINVGRAAGQTVFHLHVHVIPRYTGDVADPRGGVRHVIPAKANYLTGAPNLATAGTPLLGPPPAESGLLPAPEVPLLPRLCEAIDRAIAVDLCVAFVVPSGVELLWSRLRDLLRRKGRLRLLTGDYLDVTDPDAIARLADLGPEADLRVYQSRGRSFHPKGYLTEFADGTALAFIGSSNLSASALESGTEWNWQVVSARDRRDVREIRGAFDRLFTHPDTRPVTPEWIRDYRKRRIVRPAIPGAPADGLTDRGEPPEPPPAAPSPTPIQQEALDALQATREVGNQAGLVVLATGLGKTWLAAFDSDRPEFRRILFIAHREEILEQARATFRRLHPTVELGFYSGSEKLPEAPILFAMVQTLGRDARLRTFARDRFDYVVIDEFHHAAAPTYRSLLAHFQPKFFLGLTATPDRSDGADLLGLCGENLVYECDLVSGIRRGQLVPFHYFGVPDLVDYDQIPWRSSRFDDAALTAAVATRERAENALNHWRQHRGERSIGFCVSQLHADFMATYFAERGEPSVALHSGENSSPRTRALQDLAAGKIRMIFVVDLFNEGLDLPAIDTVLMLRPTESVTLWLQQFGRGLRRSVGKTHLTVVDYVGNHRVFLTAPRALLGVDGSGGELRKALLRIQGGESDLPDGCSITYDLASIDVLTTLLRPSSRAAAVEDFYHDYRVRHGRRPTALETWHAGLEPGKNPFGTWQALVREHGDDPVVLPQPVRRFLDHLETSPMTRSYKFVLLQALLAENVLPGEIPIDRLVSAFRRIVERNAILRADVGVALESDKALKRHLEANPIDAWVGGKGTGGTPYFEYREGVFQTRPELQVPAELLGAFRDWVEELSEWRLGDYLGRNTPRPFAAKVIHSNGRPILMLPDRRLRPDLPSGWVSLIADGQSYEANFVKIALNVVQRPGTSDNVLPQLLRKWFGPEAGQPGSHEQVAFKPGAGGIWRVAKAREQER